MIEIKEVRKIKKKRHLGERVRDWLYDRWGWLVLAVIAILFLAFCIFAVIKWEDIAINVILLFIIIVIGVFLGDKFWNGMH